MARKEKIVVVNKEMDEVLKFVVDLIKTIKNKGDYTSLLPSLIAAIEGVSEIPAELKDTVALINTGALFVADLAEVFVVAEPVAEVAADQPEMEG